MQTQIFMSAVEKALFSYNRSFLVDGETTYYTFDCNGKIVVRDLNDKSIYQKSKYRLWRENIKEYLKVDHRVFELVSGPVTAICGSEIKTEIQIKLGDEIKIFKRLERE